MESWISAHEAMRLLGPGNQDAAQRWAEVIVARVGHELIPVRAEAFILNGERQEGEQPYVAGRLFRAYNLEQNWVTGDFSARPNPTARNPISFQAFGVQFRRADIESLVPSGGVLKFPQNVDAGATATPAPLEAGTKARSNRGRKPDQEAWSRFAAAFAVVASRDDIDPHASAASIYDTIATYLNNEMDEPVFGEETARNAITLAQQWKQGIRGIPAK